MKTQIRSCFPLRIPRTIQPLVVLQGADGDPFVEVTLSKDFPAVSCVLFDPVKFFIRKLPGGVQDLIRNVHFADIVEQPDQSEQSEIVLIITGKVCIPEAEKHHIGQMKLGGIVFD